MTIWQHVIPACILAAALAAYFLAPRSGGAAAAVRLCFGWLAPFYLMTVGFVSWSQAWDLWRGVPYFLLSAVLFFFFMKRTSRQEAS